MARRAKKKPEVDKKLIIEAFTDMAKHNNIDRDLLQGVLEETISMIVRKKYGMESNFEIIVNMDKGDIEIYLMKDIVKTVEEPELEISLEEVRKYTEEDEYDIGDEFIEEITLDNIADNFGRRLVALASQNLNQRIREIEKDQIFEEYTKKEGEIVVGEIHQVRRHDILVVIDKVEMRIPREEQIPNESYKFKKTHNVKAIIKEVRRSGQSGQPDIILSRASGKFLERLFEIEIPEIYDGIIQIKSIARDPGERSKVAVVSFDDRVDPVGACVGMKGIRIHSIVRELNNENIDLIEYADQANIFIMRALSPAKVKDIQINEEARTANVTLPEDQVSLAIGRNGQNVRLASRLTGYQITLVKEGAEDIDIQEFSEELGDDLLGDLLLNEIKTAREFLNAPLELIMGFEGVTKELMTELRQIMLGEFDETEQDEVLAKINLIAKIAESGEEKSSETESEEEVGQEKSEEKSDEKETDKSEV
jgi:transcription termination/antitermination protein NusA